MIMSCFANFKQLKDFFPNAILTKPTMTFQSDFTHTDSQPSTFYHAKWQLRAVSCYVTLVLRMIWDRNMVFIHPKHVFLNFWNGSHTTSSIAYLAIVLAYIEMTHNILFLYISGYLSDMMQPSIRVAHTKWSHMEPELGFEPGSARYKATALPFELSSIDWLCFVAVLIYFKMGCW